MRFFIGALVLYVGIAWSASAQDNDFSELSLDELTNLKVYSVTRKSEDRLFSPSSVYVITAEDLKQMGVTHIADALRTVPGIQVAKLSSNKWMVASRGFGEQFSNKLLVLIDGRPVYSTLYSGVTWDQYDLILDDIKQIEVIRGTGSTIWGSNAVNGVINIITKPSNETIGNYANVVAGNYDKGIGEVRIGRALSKHSAFRIGAKFQEQDDNKNFDQAQYQDNWKNGSVQFRYDNRPNYENSYSLVGSLYAGNESQLYSVPTLTSPFRDIFTDNEVFKGFYTIGTWQHGLGDKGDLNVTSFVDYNHWNYVQGSFDTKTFGLDGQHDFNWEKIHALSWGGGYKLVATSIDNTAWFVYTPDQLTDHYLNTFVQDEITLLPKRVFLTLGTKLESNSYVVFDYQPSAKLAWRLTSDSMVWGSVSRATRIPSIGTKNLSLQLVGAAPGYTSSIGSSHFQSEKLLAYEVGFKSTPTTGIYLDAVTYYNSYRDLRTFESATPFGNIAVPKVISNNGQAGNYGFEVSAKYQPSMNFWISGAYTYTKLNFELNDNSTNTIFLNDEGKWPQQMFNLRSTYQINNALAWNNSLYYMDSLPSIQIKHYVSFNSNLVWSINDHIEMAFAAENIFASEHKEYSAPLFGFSNKVAPSYYVRLTSQF